MLRTQDSRGGSRFMHEHVVVGSELRITMPVNLFPLFLPGRRHLLVAGGIGITPIYAMAEELRRTGADYRIHYAVRGEAHGAFIAELRERHGDRLRLYRNDRQEILAMADILPNQPLGSGGASMTRRRASSAAMARARSPVPSVEWSSTTISSNR